MSKSHFEHKVRTRVEHICESWKENRTVWEGLSDWNIANVEASETCLYRMNWQNDEMYSAVSNLLIWSFSFLFTLNGYSAGINPSKFMDLYLKRVRFDISWRYRFYILEKCIPFVRLYCYPCLWNTFFDVTSN